MYYNIRTVLQDLPGSLPGFVHVDIDDFYTIVLNARLNFESRQLAYAHEYDHITGKDFNKNCTADEIELMAH